MTVPVSLITAAVVALVVAAGLTPLLAAWARRRGYLDLPNARSSHSVATPRIGGTAMVLAFLTGLAVLWLAAGPPGHRFLFVAGGAVVIALLGLRDDLRSLSALVRLIVHAGVAAAVVTTTGPLAWPWIPEAFAGLLTLLWIVTLTNAYNFMDGIDGIAGTQALLSGLGWFLVGSMTGRPELAAPGLVVAAASAGFLIYNWHPAKVFMGDAGSGFLGFLFAALPLAVRERSVDLTAVAMLLAWPFLFDTGFTLLRRIRRRENILQAHRSHLYQRLTMTGVSHARVTVLYGALAVLGGAVSIVIAASPVRSWWAAGAVLMSAAAALWGFVVRRERHAARRSAWPLTTVMLCAGAVGATGAATLLGRSEPGPPPALQRLDPAVVADHAENESSARWTWTQYADYRTIRLGRIERPARLLHAPAEWSQEVRVPPGGARYEAFVGSPETSVRVTVQGPGDTRFEVAGPAGAWTRVTLALDDRNGGTQRLSFGVHAPAGTTAAWSTATVTASARTLRRPDVILISLDTVRRDQLTPYVPSLDSTPALAAFTRRATRFDRAIATSSWTIGSHSVLFTGRFPAESLGYGSRVEPAEVTLPEIFAAAGYRTFGVSGGPYTDPRWGLHQGFDEYVVSGERENAQAAVASALEWLEAGEAPAFVFLNLFDAHEPLELSARVRSLTGVTEAVGADLWFRLDSGQSPVTPEIRRRLLTAYRAQLRSIDTALAALFESLDTSGRLDDTVVVIWSDHGQLLGERGFVGHAYTLDEELLNVPLIVKAAHGTSFPASYPYLIQEDDLFLLIPALAGIGQQAGVETHATIAAGRPLRRLAFSRLHHEPSPVLMAQRRWRSATQWAVRHDRMKIVRDREGRETFYEIDGPEERVTERSPAGAELLAALDRFQSLVRPSARTVGPLSPEEIERLRALGYVQ